MTILIPNRTPDPDLDALRAAALAAEQCDCLQSGTPAPCGSCDFAPKLRPRLSLTLAAQLHDAIDQSDEDPRP